MTPEGLFSCLQEPVSGSYAEPDKSTCNYHRSDSGFPSKKTVCISLLPTHAAFPTLLILLDLAVLTKYTWQGYKSRCFSLRTSLKPRVTSSYITTLLYVCITQI
jgi:hypothetical protein